MPCTKCSSTTPPHLPYSDLQPLEDEQLESKPGQPNCIPHIILSGQFCSPENVLLRTRPIAHRLCARLLLRFRGARLPVAELKYLAWRCAHQLA
jgi:hypothetical protein